MKIGHWGASAAGGFPGAGIWRHWGATALLRPRQSRFGASLGHWDEKYLSAVAANLP
ncbi:MAG: hypothetical protein ACHBN1_12275 [Heteroscytonema crispum UTEX LB 1556]